jgi:DNA-binding NtrC family response regulator
MEYCEVTSTITLGTTMTLAADIQPEYREHRVAALIAEDEILIRWAVAEELRAANWDVIEVATADDAIELLQTAIEVDVVVTDVNMPGRNKGLDLAKVVVRERPDTKVVIMSGHAQPEAGDERLYDLFVSKPFDERYLADRLRSLMAGNMGVGLAVELHA